MSSFLNRRKTILAAILLLVCGIAVLLWRDAESARTAIRAVERTYQVLNTAELLLSTVQDAETGQRGYLLTGDESYLAPYRSALAAEQPLRAHLALLVADNPAQAARVKQIDRVVRQKLEDLARTVQSERSVDRAAALKVVRTGEGERLMNNLRDLIHRMEAEEQRLRVESAAASRSHAIELQRTLLIGFVALLVLLAITGSLAERHILWHERAEAALRESSLFHQQIVACASEGIVVYDRDLRYRAWNRCMEQMTGVPAEELIGKHPADVFPFLTETGVLKGLERALSGEVVQSPDFSFSVKSSGEVRWCVDTSSPLRDVSGQIIGVIGIVYELTERKRLQDQFIQGQKMEAIGSLAGGVAHDFNNLLTVINGYSDLLLGRMSEGDPLRMPIQQIRWSGERAAGLTQQLLAFSRKQIIEPKVLDLNQLVSDMRNILRRLIGENIRIEINLDPALGRILADAGQLTQVVMNLAVNARDAMPNGGALTMETADVEFPEGAKPPAVPGRFVRLTVADTGVGIDSATLQRIFEPFFTTKGEGKGTGLGLSTVYGIVQQCGGWVTVESAPGRGTTFRVFLPRTQVADSDPETIAQLPAEMRGIETILVVEDQDEVRRFIIEALRGYGYRILDASEPGEALLIAERHAGPIHLLLSDVVLPHLTGVELAARLKPLRADMRVLYMTGHSEQAILGDDFFQSGGALIRKPFNAYELARKIREVLGPPC